MEIEHHFCFYSNINYDGLFFYVLFQKLNKNKKKNLKEKFIELKLIARVSAVWNVVDVYVKLVDPIPCKRNREERPHVWGKQWGSDAITFSCIHLFSFMWVLGFLLLGIPTSPVGATILWYITHLLVPIFVYKARSCKREAFGNPMPPLPSFIFPSLASYCSIPFEITTRFPCYHNSLSFLSFLDLFSNPPCNGLVNCACLSPSLKGLEDLFGNHHKKNTKACLLKFRMKVGLHFRNAMMWEHLISDDQECCSVVLCGYGRVNINVIWYATF